MQIIYNKPKGQRINKQFMTLTTEKKDWMWSKEDNKLIKSEFYSKAKSGFNDKIHSLKAAVRYLKKYSSYLPKGTEFILVSRFAGYDVKIII